MSRLGLQVLAAYPSEAMREFARFAENQGWDSVWLPEGMWKDPLVELASLAGSTERIRLATGIATIYNRTPLTLAQAAIALDDISGGRFVLGLGTGHRDRTENLHGTRLEKPVARMRDYVTIIREAMSGSAFDYAGEAFSVRGLQQWYSSPHPVPVYIACLGPAMSRLAGEVADGAVLHLATPQGTRRIRQQAEEAARAAGRDPEMFQVVPDIMCNIPKDLAQARREMAHEVARYGRWPFYRAEMARSGFAEEVERIRQAWEEGDGEKAARQVSEAMLRELPLAAGVDEVWEKTQRLWESGADVVVLNMRPLKEDPVGSIRETLEALAS